MQAAPLELPRREKLAPVETEPDSEVERGPRELEDARGERDAARDSLDSARPELRHLRGELKKLQEELKESQSDSAAQRDRAERVSVELQAAQRRHLEELARLRAEILAVETRRSDMQALESALAAAREDAERSRAAVQALQEQLASTRGEARGAPTRGGRRSSRGLSLSVGRAPMAALRGVRREIARAEVGMFLLVLVLGFAVAWLVVHLP